MTQLLSAPITLAEDLSSVPGTQPPEGPELLVTPALEESDASGPYRHIHIHIHRETLVHKHNKKEKLKKQIKYSYYSRCYHKM